MEPEIKHSEIVEAIAGVAEAVVVEAETRAENAEAVAEAVIEANLEREMREHVDGINARVLQHAEEIEACRTWLNETETRLTQLSETVARIEGTLLTSILSAPSVEEGAPPELQAEPANEASPIVETEAIAVPEAKTPDQKRRRGHRLL